MNTKNDSRSTEIAMSPPVGNWLACGDREAPVVLRPPPFGGFAMSQQHYEVSCFSIDDL